MDLNFFFIKNINKNIDQGTEARPNCCNSSGCLGACPRLVTVQAVVSEKKSPGTKITGENGDMAILWELVGFNWGKW
jgi:hypothetical protein